MVVTRLYFEIPSQNSGTTEYTIDLARELSKHHRRLIRQKQLFTVYGGLYQDSDGSNGYISTAPLYWVTKRSINRSFKAWKLQLHEAMSAANQTDGTALVTSKYNDFKIYLDNHTSANYLKAKDASGAVLPEGEWVYSSLTMPRPDEEVNGQWRTHDSDQFSIMIVGPHASTGTGSDLNYSRVGAINSWFDSRPVKDGNSDSPKDNPNLDNDPITLMFRQGDSDEDVKIIEAINDHNDTPPYDMDILYGTSNTSTDAGANLQMQCIVSPDSNSGVAQVPGFQALCGLVRFTVTGDTGNSGAALILDVESNGVGF